MGKVQRKAFRAALILASLWTGMVTAETPAPADFAQEEAFLNVLPKVDVPDDVQPIPGAVNEEFHNCEAHWPPEYAVSQKGLEARAYRDIYGYVKARNVIATKDCTCTGKVAAWSDVELIAVAIRKAAGNEPLNWQATKSVFDTSNEMFPVAETMCGGSF
jgi:hypothetical protein